MFGNLGIIYTKNHDSIGINAHNGVQLSTIIIIIIYYRRIGTKYYFEMLRNI